eukprot:224891-Pyramimonas_sp.AAC.1
MPHSAHCLPQRWAAGEVRNSVKGALALGLAAAEKAGAADVIRVKATGRGPTSSPHLDKCRLGSGREALAQELFEWLPLDL